jgi:CBS domain-containing protein
MAEQVRDVMTPEPACVSAEDTTDKAAQLMRDRDVGSIVVTENGSGVAGIVTDRDIVVRAVADGKNPTEVRVSEVASSNPATLSPDDAINDAIGRMREENIRRLPVVEGDRPVGIVSLGDLARAQDPNSVLGDISAAPPNN